jgi:hypothetical protein
MKIFARIYAVPPKSYDIEMTTNILRTYIISDISTLLLPFSPYKKLDVNYDEYLFYHH